MCVRARMRALGFCAQRGVAGGLRRIYYMVDPIWGSFCLVFIAPGISSNSRDFPLPTLPKFLATTPLFVADDRLFFVVSFSCPGGGFGRRRRSQAWRSACPGVIRAAGSHSRQRFMKSWNSGSSQPLSAVTRSLLPGGPRYFPRRDLPPCSVKVPSLFVVAVQYLGYPLELIKLRARFDTSSSFCGGMP